MAVQLRKIAEHAVPRGDIFFAELLSTGAHAPMFCLGNCPGFQLDEMGLDQEEVTDWGSSSATPLGYITKKIVPAFSVKMKQYVNPVNLALTTLSPSPTAHTQAATPVVGESLGVVHVGGIYRTAKMKITAVALKSGSDTFSATTDYAVINAEIGLIQVLALPTGVVDGDPLSIDYTPTAIVAGDNVLDILGGTLARKEGEFLYAGTNIQGPRYALDIWHADVSLDGSISMISDGSVEFGIKVKTLTDPNHTELFRMRQLATNA